MGTAPPCFVGGALAHNSTVLAGPAHRKPAIAKGPSHRYCGQITKHVSVKTHENKHNCTRKTSHRRCAGKCSGARAQALQLLLQPNSVIGQPSRERSIILLETHRPFHTMHSPTLVLKRRMQNSLEYTTPGITKYHLSPPPPKKASKAAITCP